MKRLLLLTLVLGLFNISFSQNFPKKITKYIPKAEPETNIEVNKEFDENGNLIRYDSTYTSYYSSSNISPEMADSIMKQFGVKFHFGTPETFMYYPFSENISKHQEYFDQMRKQQREMMNKMIEEFYSDKQKIHYQNVEPKLNNETDI